MSSGENDRGYLRPVVTGGDLPFAAAILERLFPTEGFADDLEPLIAREKRLERLEERGIIVDEQDTNR